MNAHNDVSQNDKKTDIGISLLRIIMSFVVIVDHFGDGKTVTGIRASIGSLAVPCFMFISFYLLAPKLCEITGELISQRLKRLYLPLAIWTIISYIIYTVMSHLGIEKVKVSNWRIVFYSLLFGSVENFAPHFWFNITQIIIFCFVIALFCIQMNKLTRIGVLYLFIVGSFFIERSGINSFLFGSSPYEIAYPLGRVAETLPFALSGILVSEIKTERYKWISIIVGIMGMVISLLTLGFIFDSNHTNFGYSGTGTYFISIAICLLIVSFNFCPTGNIASVVNYLAALSAGIYYMHYIVGKCISTLLEMLEVDSLSFGLDVAIWCMCIVTTALLYKLSRKTTWIRYLVV